MMDVKFKSEALCRAFLEQRDALRMDDLSHEKTYTLRDGSVLKSDAWWVTWVSPDEINFYFDVLPIHRMGSESAMMWALEDSEASE